MQPGANRETAARRRGRPEPTTLRILRPRLDAQLPNVHARRLTVVGGGAGYGKSTLVSSWSEGVPTAWCALDADCRALPLLFDRVASALAPWIDRLPPDLQSMADAATSDDPSAAIARAEGFAARLAELSNTLDDEDRLLVFDDLHELDGAAPALRFVEALLRGAPESVHLVITSRLPIPFQIERLRGQGQVLELTPEQIAFDLSETRVMLELLDDQAAGLASRVHELTGGWPALVRLVIEALRVAPADRRPQVVERLGVPGGPLFSYVAEEVMASEPPETRAFLRIAARFDRIDAELMVAVGVEGAAGIIGNLRRRAFFVESHGNPEGSAVVLHGLIREVALASMPMPGPEVRALHKSVAAWHRQAGRIGPMIDASILADEPAEVISAIEAHGFDLVQAGDLDVVVRAARWLPESARSRRIETITGDALLRRGDWDAALAAFARAGSAEDPLPAALAWRIGVIQHERGDVPAALATFERAQLDVGDPSDLALVAAWRAIAYWQRSDPDGCRPWATFALEVATRSGDERAMACALASMGALAHLEGDLIRSVESLRKAVDTAEQAGDILLQVRFRTDLGYVLLLQGRYAHGLEQLDSAVRSASGLGHSSFLALALADRALALMGLGRLEEAAADLAGARELFERVGSRWVAYAMLRQANLHRLRGELLVAKTAYRDALANASSLGSPWFLGEAIIGLAAATVEDDPEEGVRLADEALAAGGGSEFAAAVALGAARVALTAGKRERATELADLTAEIGAKGDRPSLAGALEVRAELEGDRRRAADLLDEARAIWNETGSIYGLARHDLVRARVLGGTDGAEAANRAAVAFLEMGAKRQADTASTIARRLEALERPFVEIRALGAFRVIRDGEPVALVEWQSKKARDVLKILVARRGRPVTREHLAELLWPDEDPGPVANRLSVALATIRSVLDPTRRYPPDHFLVANKTTVALDLTHVTLDTEAFISAVARARRPRSADDVAATTAALAGAEAAYGGDFLEEDPYEDWAVGLREETRALYLEVARELARLAIAAADADAAVRLYLRILERDGYDEEAHLGLVRALASAGRHGEARRRYAVYTERMAELDLEATSFPSANVERWWSDLRPTLIPA